MVLGKPSRNVAPYTPYTPIRGPHLAIQEKEHYTPFGRVYIPSTLNIP